MNDVLPNSLRHGHLCNRKVQKSVRIPNHQRLPDLEPNVECVNMIRVTKNGTEVTKYPGVTIFGGESNLLVSNIKNRNKGKNIIDRDGIDLKFDRCLSAAPSPPRSGEREIIAATIVTYVMTNNIRLNRIHEGRKTNIHDILN